MKHKITNSAVIMFFLFFSLNSLFSQYDEEQIKKKLPKIMGATNMGTDFWLTIPPCYEVSTGNNFIKLFVAAKSATHVTLEVAGKKVKIEKDVQPNSYVEFNLTPSDGQCYLHKPDKTPPSEKVYKQNAINIYSDNPVIVYCAVRYLSISDGFLVLPVEILGNEYLASSYGDMGALYLGNYPSEVGIVSPYNQNKVNFTMGGNTVSKTAGGLKPGESVTDTLNKGDVWMFSSFGYEGDLTGSRIKSSLPVAVVSGNFCTNIPTSNKYCDYTAEMDLPTYIWGKTYHIPIIYGRKYASIIRIFPKIPETTIYRDGAIVAKLPESGGLLGKGWIEMRYVPMGESKRPVVFTADKPIGITLCNTGALEDGDPMPNSDPFTMALLPIESYSDSITLVTPGIKGGSGFEKNYLDVIYETDEDGEMPDDMMFGSLIENELVFEMLKVKFPSTDERFIYDINGRKFSIKNISLAASGMYSIKSSKPFAVYSYGFNACDSYGFPSGLVSGNEENADRQKPVPSWTMECTGSVIDGYVIDKPDIDFARSNISAIYLGTGSFNYKLTTSKIESNLTKEAQWQIEVINKNLPSKAIVEFWDGSGNDTSIIIQNKMSALKIDRDIVDFGNLYPDSVYYENIILSNNSNEPIILTEIELKNSSSGFSTKELALPITIEPGKYIETYIKFQSHAVGSYSDTLIIGDGCVSLYKARMTANIVEPVIAVNDINFGNVLAGEQYIKTFTITNYSKIDIEITGLNGNYLNEFKHNIGPVSVSNPFILPANATKTVAVTFNSDKKGTFKDSIVFISPAGSKLDNVAVLSAECKLIELACNSWDWGKVRIHKENDSAGPYGTDSIPGQPRAIIFENNSGKVITVNGINKIIESNQEDKKAFIFNENDFIFELKPGEKHLAEVKFQPTRTGLHQITMYLLTNASTLSIPILKGIGIIPRGTIPGIVFGQSIVNGPDNVKKMAVKIRNSIYDYAQTLVITDFKSGPNEGDVSSDVIAFGSQGFRYDKQALFEKYGKNGRIEIEPGDSITLEAEFQAVREGYHQAWLKAVSNNDTELKSVWTGLGLKGTSAGEENNPESTVIIVPNPTDGSNAVIKMLSDIDIEAEYSIANISGVQLANSIKVSLQTGENAIPLDLGMYPSGTYYLVIRIGGRTEQMKFSVVK